MSGPNEGGIFSLRSTLCDTKNTLMQCTTFTLKKEKVENPLKISNCFNSDYMRIINCHLSDTTRNKKFI